MNTSERVDALIQQSEHIYAAIDPVTDGEPRYRRMLRTGFYMAARALRDGHSVSEAGYALLALPAALPTVPLSPLDSLASAYADVSRATLDHAGNSETNARHAIHLMKLAVPYAMKHYPALDGGKVAAYTFFHDTLEFSAGDHNSLGITSAQEAQKNIEETAALEVIRTQYGDTYPEIVALLESYENLSDPESRFSKSIDKTDPSYTHLYNNGTQLKKRYGNNVGHFIADFTAGTKKMEHYAADFPLILADRVEFQQRIMQSFSEKAA